VRDCSRHVLKNPSSLTRAQPTVEIHNSTYTGHGRLPPILLRRASSPHSRASCCRCTASQCRRCCL
jgi:hypothetical protein